MPDMLQLGMSADGSDLISSLTESRSALKVTESAFAAFGNAIASTMKFAGNTVVATAHVIENALGHVAVGALSELGAMATHAAADSVRAMENAAKSTTQFLGVWTTLRLGLAAASWTVAPWLAPLSIALTTATVATTAYANANEGLVQKLNSVVLPIENTTKALRELSKAAAEDGSAFRSLGGDMADISVAWASQVVEVSGATSKLKEYDSTVGSVLSAAAKHLGPMGEGYRILADRTLDWVDNSRLSAESLRNITAASERLIEQQKSQADAFARLGEMQSLAATQAQHSGELQRIASIASVEAINAEILALRERAVAAIAAGDASEESARRVAALFAALENQRVKIEAGGMKKEVKESPVESAIKRAIDALNAEKFGVDDAQLINLQGTGASDEELDRLKRIQDETAAQKALNAAKEEQKKLEESAADQIARLKDQIDLVEKSATKGEIALREMLREGFSTEQAEEVRRLTDELEKAQKDSQDKKADKAVLKSAFAGSSEAASIVTRGINVADKDKTAEKHLGVAQQTLIAIKAIKMPNLQPLSI